MTHSGAARTRARRAWRPAAAILAVGFALAVARHSALGAGPNDPVGRVRAGGLTRTYRIHVPASYRPGRAVALVLAFHGRLGDGKGMAHVTGLDTTADRHGFIVVYPDGVDRSWNDGLSTPAAQAGVDDVAFVRTLIASLRARYTIDARRIYATGLSNGAMFTELLGCELAGTLAAIAPVAGSLPVPVSAELCPARPVPVLLIHGTSDPFVPYDGGALRSGVGSVLSAPATLARWSQLDGCAGPSRSRALPARVHDGTSVTLTVEGGCPPHVAVALDTIVGGGHTWPGGWQYLPALIVGPTSRQIDASETIWSFFAAHPLARVDDAAQDPSNDPASGGTSTACSRRAASGTMSSARSWVDRRTTYAAAPSRCARSQFAAVTHQRSPGTRPSNPYCGAGVTRSLPISR